MFSEWLEIAILACTALMLVIAIWAMDRGYTESECPLEDEDNVIEEDDLDSP